MNNIANQQAMLDKKYSVRWSGPAGRKSVSKAMNLLKYSSLRDAQRRARDIPFFEPHPEVSITEYVNGAPQRKWFYEAGACLRTEKWTGDNWTQTWSM